MSEPFDPRRLVAFLGLGLRATARRLAIDPAMFYRRWSDRQADRYAVRLGHHPGEVWAEWWDVDDDVNDGTAECARNHDEGAQVKPASEADLLADTQVDDPGAES